MEIVSIARQRERGLMNETEWSLKTHGQGSNKF